MQKMTEENLTAAFAGESQAHMKYLAFAAQAMRDQRPNVAKLFEAIAYAERVHATNHLRELGGIGTTEANLGGAIGGETFEVEQMYPAYDAVAKAQGEAKAERSIHYAFEAEKIHAGMYGDALAKVKEGADIEAVDVYICPVCGHTVFAGAPDRCPVCNARGSSFRKF